VLEAVDQAENTLPEASLLPAAPGQSGFLALAQLGRRFALAYGESTAEARARADAGLECDLKQVIAQRLAFINRLPALPDAAENHFLRKCASVLKVNALADPAAFASVFPISACPWMMRSGQAICGGGRPGSISIILSARLCESAVTAAKPGAWRRLPWRWCAGNTSTSGWCLSSLTPPAAL
jgi:hypothetical protein